MSFLVASGHVSVEAKTGDAKRDIAQLIRTLGGLGPASTTAAGGLEKLRDRGAAAARALHSLGNKADAAERALVGLRAVAGTIKVTAELDDDTTSGVAAVKAALQDLKSEGPVRLNVTFDGQAAQIIAAARAMRDLRGDAVTAGTALGRLATRAAEAAIALNSLEQQAEDAARALRNLRGRAVAAAFALAELRDRATSANNALRTLANRAGTADGRLGDLSTRTRSLRGDMDDLDGSVTNLTGHLGGLNGRFGNLGRSGGQASGGMRQMMMAAIALSPALIPVAASATLVGSQMVAGLGAGAVAVVAFGAALAPQIVAMSKIGEAQKAYTDAVKEHGAASKEALAAEVTFGKAVGRSSPEVRKAAASLSVMKDEYKAWSKSLEGDTLGVATKSFAVLGAIFPRLTPVVRGASVELSRFMTIAAGGVAGSGFKRMMDDFAVFAQGSLQKANNGLVHMMRTLSQGGLSSGGLAEFIKYAKENGPLVGQALRNIGEAFAKLIAGASDVGVSLLTVISAMAKLVASLPTSLITTMLQLAIAMKAVTLAAAGARAVGLAYAALRVQLIAMGTAAVGASGALMTLRVAFAALSTGAKLGVVVAGVALLVVAIKKISDAGRAAPPDVDKLTTSLGRLAQTGKLSGEAARVLGEDLGGLSTALKTLSDPSIGEGVEKWLSDLTGIDTVNIKEAKAPIEGIDKALAGMVKGGNPQLAAAALAELGKNAKANGQDMSELRPMLDSYDSALADLAFENKLVADSMGVFGRQAQATSAKLDAQKASAEGLRQAITNLNDTNRAAYDSQIAFEGAIDALTASFKEHGASLDLDTEAGRKNGTAMSGAAKAHDEMVAAGLAAGESLGSMTSKSGTLRAEMMRLAMTVFDNKQKATAYVNTLLGTPGEIKTMVKLERAEAISGLKSVQAEIKKTPGAKSVKVSTLNAAAIKALEAVGLKTRNLPDGRTEVFTKNGQSLGGIGAVLRALNNLDGKTANTYTTHTVTYHKRTTYDKDGSGIPDSVQAPKGATGGRYTGRSFTGYASGGPVRGPGTGTSDDVFAPWLSAGEWVIKDAAVRKYGDKFMASVNDGTLKLGPGFAKGGKLTEKQKEAARTRADARGSLKNNATLTDMSIIASGGKGNAEISSTLGKERSEGALVDFLNKLQTTVSKAGFSPKTNSALQKQITASAKKLFAQNDALDKVTASLDKAKSGLDDLKGKFDSLKTSVASSLIGFANVTKIGKYGTSPETLIKQLQSDTTRTTDFAKQLEQLKAKGLNGTAISDIAQAGVAGGGMATAESLLTATPEQIAKINELQKQLTASANAAGKTTADAMYGAGIKAAEGIVAGLTAKKAAIESAMMSIAKAMEAAIKKALGIKSPAKRLEPVGDFAFQGVERGWTKSMTKGRTLLSGSAAPVYRPNMLTAPGVSMPQGTGAGIVVNLSPTFHTMTLPSVGERKAFAKAMAAEFSDAIRERDRERRR
ncbi:hypothetical protein [Streptomyces sp. NPDC002994]|uniref:hypothetical protein n=1 Tax=Streptomyces sp. NPDC002994 TaxID=3154441 RepID=UPI0033AB6527